MFIGEFSHSLDAKNRVILPIKFRECFIESQFVLTRGLDNCLFMYPIKEWEILKEKLNTLSLTKKDARSFTRLIFSGASMDTFDKQGRVLIPDSLKKYAAITKKVVITGALNRVEIWSQPIWDKYIKKGLESFEEIAENLIDI